MQSLAKTIRVSEFFSVAIQLCKESAQIINEVRNSGNLEKVMKGKDDPVTMADLKAQTTIFGGLRHFFPGITLVGEEDEEYKGEITLNFKSINKNLLPFEIFTNSDTSKVLLDEELNMNDVIVFVDPLDATLSFTKNELENITTLIGLAYQKRPYLGVIGHPFKKKDEANYEFNPRIYFSHRNVKKVFYLNADEVHSGVTGVLPWQLKRNNSNDESKERKLRVAITNSRFSEKMQAELDLLGVNTILRIGGTGNKVLTVLKGDADCYLYNREGTKRWDTCACEPLLESMGGIMTNARGELIDYGFKEDKKDYNNSKGILAMMDVKWHSEILEKLKSISKD